MAILDTTFNRIKESLDKDISLDDLENILFDFGLELESYNQEDDQLKIDVTADRPDLLSFQGFIRALRSYLDLEKISKFKVHNSKYKVVVDKNMKDVRPYTLCVVIKNLNLDNEKLKEIINSQEKLHLTLARKRKVGAIGIYPMENIKFPIKFTSKKPEDIKFIALGDNKEKNAKQILKEHTKGKEYAHLLENKNSYPIFVDNNKNILSLPPIINSKKTGNVTINTKNIFLECSGFNLERLRHILNILVSMFADFGGDIYLVKVEYEDQTISSPNLDFEKRIVSNTSLNKLLGTAISIEDTCKYLEKMMYITKKKSKDKIEVLIPPFRSDVLHDVDIADDLARAYGFSNIEFRKSRVTTIGELHFDSILQDNIVEIMGSLGYQDIKTLCLSSKKKAFEDFNISKDYFNYMSLGYSKDKSLDIIVPWLTPKLFDVLKNNQHMVFPQKLFNCDYIVEKNKDSEVRSNTNLHLAAVFANSKVSFTKMVSEIYTLFNSLGKDLELHKKNYDFYIKGRSAEIVVDSKSIGYIGEISPKVLKNKEYYMPVCSFEIDLNKLE